MCLVLGYLKPVQDASRVFSTLQIALRIMFDHILLPLSVCLDPQEVIAEAREVCIVMKDLCMT